MTTNGHASKQHQSFSDARLGGPPGELQKRYYMTPRLKTEMREFSQFIQIDLAHATMLTEQGIIPHEVYAKLAPLLQHYLVSGPSSMNVDLDQGSLLLQVEHRLCGELGEAVAGRLHTARSRIDQGGTARRLYYRDTLLTFLNQLHRLENTLIAFSAKHIETIMPYYTHMQQAQPGILGHQILSYVTKMHDSFERSREVYARVNKSPLGAVGLSGTSWPINRKRSAELLGFDGLVSNSRLALDCNYAVEIALCLSLVMNDLNDLATDLHLWSGTEFAFVDLDDTFCSTSSIFPQKKNPVTLEAIKLHTGQATTWPATALATFRGEGSGDHAVHEVSHLKAACDLTIGDIDLMCGIVDTLRVNSLNMSARLSHTWSTASNLADILVRKYDLSFRQAHHVVAKLVRDCEHQSIPRSLVTPEQLVSASIETIGRVVDMGSRDLHLALDPQEFVRTRSSDGGVSPGEIAKLLLEARRNSEEDHDWLKTKEMQVEAAHQQLQRAIEAILA